MCDKQKNILRVNTKYLKCKFFTKDLEKHWYVCVWNDGKFFFRKFCFFGFGAIQNKVAMERWHLLPKINYKNDYSGWFFLKSTAF
jgi:hypothetical protein